MPVVNQASPDTDVNEHESSVSEMKTQLQKTINVSGFGVDQMKR